MEFCTPNVQFVLPEIQNSCNKIFPVALILATPMMLLTMYLAEFHVNAKPTNPTKYEVFRLPVGGVVNT